MNTATSNFNYDNIYQLTGVTGTAPESYSYDAVGNRLSSQTIANYSYNSSNELTSSSAASYTYDNNGNTLTKALSSGTTQYGWDFEDRLISVQPSSGGTVSFKYDPFGRRIQKAGASATNYVYDGSDVIEEVDSSENLLAKYSQAAGVDEPLSELRSSAVSYYEQDGLGSATSLTNTGGSLANTYVYDSFGNLTSSTGSITNPYQYTGRDYDPETGLRYYRARYYSPDIGRFISEDPIEFLGGASFYTYANDEPVRLVDPLGLETEVILWNPVGYGESSLGHVSVEINGVSYSWGPGPGGGLLNKCCKAGQMKVQPAQDFINNNTKFRSGLGYVLNLTAKQETAFASFLSNYEGTYNAFLNNCGDPIVAGLQALGFHLVLPPGALLGLPPLVSTPDDLDYILGHTNGLVTGWVPYPQQPSPTK